MMRLYAWFALGSLGLGAFAACSAPSSKADAPAASAPVKASLAPGSTMSAQASAPVPETSASVPSEAVSAPPPPPPPESTGPSLPEGFVYVPDPLDDRWKASVTCGDFVVQNVKPADMVARYEPFVVVTDKAGKKVYEAHGREYKIESTSLKQSLVVEICGDLTGDAVPELMMTERTMGAHCCYTHYVVSLTSPPKRILMWEKGDSGDGISPVKIRKGKSFQLLSMDRIFPPFRGDADEPAVPYAGVPGYPIVFELVGSEYKARTFLFADWLRAEREKELAACKAMSYCERSDLYDWGIALIIGDWDQRKASIVPDAELRKAFEKRSVEMRALLRKRLGP